MAQPCEPRRGQELLAWLASLLLSGGPGVQQIPGANMVEEKNWLPEVL